LSFNKFYKILKRTDLNFGWKSNSKFLTWDSLKEQKPIKHKTSF
jgi:hypothetical protein